MDIWYCQTMLLGPKSPSHQEGTK